jgi:choline kinase
MKAIILAAGRGTRLERDDPRPKCLMEVGGRALLDRYLDVLDALGIATCLVVGYGAEAIAAHVADRPHRPSLLTNPDFLDGSIRSAAVGLGAIADDVLLLDGDVAFTPALLERMTSASITDALLVDVGAAFTDEEYLAGIDGGRVRTLRRGPVPGHEQQGEWVGFARLSAATAARLQAAIATSIREGHVAGGYEDALGALCADTPFTVIPTDGLPWVEIDFPRDLARARTLFPAPG